MNLNIQLYKSDYVIDHQEAISREAVLISDKICRLYDGVVADNRKGVYKYIGDINSTWLYPVYNIFSASSPSEHFYKINQFVYQAIKHYVFEVIKHPEDTKIWAQSWINVHKQNQLLNKHTHLFPIHGYLSIDPKETITVFFDENDEECYYINNEPGSLYIGPGYRYHEVRLKDSKFMKRDEYRITLAFNVITNQDSNFTNKIIDGASFLPIL